MRFFISHSAHGEHAKSVLAQVRVRLSVGDNEVFVNDMIHWGEQWRRALYHELAVCHAAVVLLDQASLSRRWVQREVDVLLWRQSFDPNLIIVPILLDETPMMALREHGFGELTETQFVLAHGLDAETIAIQAAERFQALVARPQQPVNTGMKQWLDNLEAVLTRIGHLDGLRRAAEDLGVDPADAVRVTTPGGFRFLAHQFLGRSQDDATAAAVHRVRYLADVDTVRKLAHLIAPSWVDPSATLPLVLHDSDRLFVAVINAKDFRTAVHYVQRATCLDGRVRIEQVSAALGEAAAAELHARCERAVVRLLGGEPPYDTVADIPPDELREGPPYPSYLVISVEGIQTSALSEVLTRLRNKYRWLVVVLLAGVEFSLPATSDGLSLEGVRVLTPALAPFEEFKAQRTVRDLFRMIDGSIGGTS